MDSITTRLHEVLLGYTGKAQNGHSELTCNADNTLFVVVGFGIIKGKRFTVTGLVVRMINNKIVIDHDANNKLLVDALLEAGIPREQIVLAYTGEPVPEPEFAFAS